MQDVNRLLKQHKQMQKMMKKMGQKGMQKMMRGMDALMSGGGMPPMPRPVGFVVAKALSPKGRKAVPKA